MAKHVTFGQVNLIFNMKHFLKCILVLLSIGVAAAKAQPVNYLQQSDKSGQFYVYWGWNIDAYTKSDIHFNGNNYDFTLDNVIAHDRQSQFDVKLYCNPLKATIPQYNFRFGYFISPHYNISFGIDHMKYVVQNLQSVGIHGYIDQSETVYDGVYDNDKVLIRPGFLEFEHTDGLNYINTEYRRMDNLIQTKHIDINMTEGISAGMLLPKTNATLLNNERYDEFHIAGYGLGALAGINVELYRYFFIQSEFKGGFINMPDIRTTMNGSDHASQHFFFAQWNVVFGVNFNLHH